MELAKKAKDAYKNASKTIDLSILIMNETIKVLNNIVRDLISTGKFDVETFNAYSSICTSHNLIVGVSHTINFARKKIVTNARDKREPEKKIINRYLKHSDVIQEQIKSLQTALAVFVPFEPDPTRQKKSSKAPVKSLNDVIQLLGKASSKLKTKYIPEIKKINKQLVPSAKRAKSKLVNGGFDKEPELQLLKIGGFSGSQSRTMVVGGKTNFIIRDKVFQYELAKELLPDMKREFQETLKRVIGGPAEMKLTPREHYNLMRDEYKIREPVEQQLKLLPGKKIRQKYEDVYKIYKKTRRKARKIFPFKFGSIKKLNSTPASVEIINEICRQIYILVSWIIVAELVIEFIKLDKKLSGKPQSLIKLYKEFIKYIDKFKRIKMPNFVICDDCCPNTIDDAGETPLMPKQYLKREIRLAKRLAKEEKKLITAAADLRYNVSSIISFEVEPILTIFKKIIQMQIFTAVLNRYVPEDLEAIGGKRVNENMRSIKSRFAIRLGLDKLPVLYNAKQNELDPTTIFQGIICFLSI